MKIPFNRPPSLDMNLNELTELCKKKGIEVSDDDRKYDLWQKYDEYYRSQLLLNYYHVEDND